MNLTALARMTNERLQETIATSTLLNWFNDAQNRLATRVNATFPSFINSDGTPSTVTEPVWDARFHDLLVTYACARYRESDEAMNEASYLDSLFEGRLADAVSYMVVSDVYKQNDDSQTFIASTGQTTFMITGTTFDSVNSTVRVFVNYNELSSSEFTFIGHDVILITSLVPGDVVRVIWENNSAYDLTPMPYQGSW